MRASAAAGDLGPADDADGRARGRRGTPVIQAFSFGWS